MWLLLGVDPRRHCCSAQYYGGRSGYRAPRKEFQVTPLFFRSCQ
jgi:hypothetical protein